MSSWLKRLKLDWRRFTSLGRRRKIAFGILVLTFFLVALFTLSNWLAPVSLAPKKGATLVVAENGLPLRKFADEQGIWRYPTELDDVSPLYIEILLNYEDRYFYQHPGVNPLSLFRAAWQWMRHGRVISGGSTITMQVARLVRPSDRTVWGKAVQILTALQLEWRYSKQAILTYYINHAPFGGRVEGVEAASLFYFGYSAQDLTYAQAALLAVLPQSPTRNRPDRHPIRARLSRDKVLARMRDFGAITEQDYLQHKLERVEVAEAPMPVLAPLLSRRLAGSNEAELVQTYIDYDKQWAATELVRSYVQALGEKVSAAVLAVENATGKVKIYLGSADFNDDSRFAHVDMVQAKRSPGSTLKPFIYGMALDLGLIHSHSLLLDVPLRFADYLPENFNDNFSGPVTAAKALTSSLNVPAVQLLEQVSPQAFYAQMVNGGIQLDLPSHAKPNLSLALGGVSSSLADLVTAYLALGNQGQSRHLNYQQASVNETFLSERPEVNLARKDYLPLLSPGAAWIIRDLLASNGNLESNSYQSTLSQQGYAVKTGTSAGHRDVWAIASGEVYTLGVWLGRPDNGAMTGHQGSLTAVPLLQQIAGILAAPRQVAARPENVSRQAVCWPLGRWSKDDCFQTHHAWVMNEHIPKTLMSIKNKGGTFDVNELELRVASDTGLRLSAGCALASTPRRVILWPESLETWLPENWRNQARIPKQDPRCQEPDTLRQMSQLEIKGVENGQVFVQAPGEALPQLQLTALNPSGGYYWYVNGRLQQVESKSLSLTLKPQVYQLTLLDQLGKVAQVEFRVKQ